MKTGLAFLLTCLALPAATITLPTTRADLANGEKLFQVHCALCHGPKGEGSRGPALAKPKLNRAPDDSALIKILDEGIRGTEMPGADSLSDRERLQTAAYVRSLGKIPFKPVPGDPARGAEIYGGKGSCAGCHAIRGEGGIAGPDLSLIGDSRSAAYLRESIVNPGAAVPEGYLLVTVAPRNAQGVTGVRMNEDSFSIQIRDNTGRSYSFWKRDLDRIEAQRGKSPMPAYEGKLTDTELTDLVAYLASLRESK